MPVVEPEREAYEVRVEGVSHVELDAERLLTRDQPPAHHRECAHEADQDHGNDDQLQCVAIVALDRLRDGGSRQERDRDLRRLGGGSEHDRHAERDLVWAQEPEQAGEGAAIRR